MTWTDERVETLKKLWTEGLSASQIAAELGGITRNAVIGKVHRLGLSGRAKSPSSAAPRPRKARPHSHMLRVSRPSIRGQSRRLPKSIVERVAGAADGADRIGIVTAVERLAQPADMDVDGALVDIDFATPHAVEKLFAREHATGPLHQKFEQTIFGRAEIDRAAGARHALLLAVDREVAERQHVGEPLGQRPPQQGPYARAQFG